MTDARLAPALPRPPTFRRWLQFSLGSLLMLTFLAAVGLQLWLNRVEPQRRNIGPLVWDLETDENILWRAKIGSQTYATPRVAGGKVFIGSNNGAGWIARYPKKIDLGVLLCFDAETGDFLWQHSNAKLPQGRVVDWPLQGIPSTPYVEGDRLWYVTNRCEVVCLDTEGFYDGEDDGPLQRPGDTVPQDWTPLFQHWATLTAFMRASEKTITWRLPVVFRKAFDRAGVDLRRTNSKARSFRGFSVRRGKADGCWTLARLESAALTPVPLYEICLLGDVLAVYPLATETERQNAREPLFSLANQRFASLASGTLSEEFRLGLEDSFGISLPPDVNVREVVPGEVWSCSLMVRDTSVDIRIRKKGNFLEAQSLVSDADKRAADVVWKFNMMGELGVFPHNMTHCSIVCAGDLIFVNTCNGVDETHVNVPSPKAPNFLAMNKHTGKVVWSDNSVGAKVLHSGWASPTYAVLGGVPQVLFPGGDGWLYSFAAQGDGKGNSKLLWKFDTNPKRSKWVLGGRGNRNSLVASAVVHDGLVYIVNGQDPEHGEGEGHLWCIDPTRRGDVSPELVFGDDDPTTPIPPRTRLQAAGPGDMVRANPNSAAMWHYDKFDLDGDGQIEFEEEFHRSLSRPAIQGGLLVVSDFSGLVHCLDVKTGKPCWTYDTLAACWSSPVIVNNYVYVGDEDGDMTILGLSSDPQVAIPGRPSDGDPTIGAIREIYMDTSIYGTPAVRDGRLFVPTKSHLYAIRPGAKYTPSKR